MKRLSIRKRVIFWYALSLLLMSALTVGFLFYIENLIVVEETKENLISITNSAVSDVSFPDGKLRIDDDMIYHMEGAYIEICRENGERIAGLLPEEFMTDVSFVPETIRSVKSGGDVFYIYDRFVESGSIEQIWIRGIAEASLGKISPALYSMMRLFIGLIPFLVFFAILVGWQVTKRAFRPLGKIVDTARQIQESSDLSRRIDLGYTEEDDEIVRTANVFDQMLSRIQTSFEREQQFTNNASHELRTPVAVIMSQSEYALRHQDDPESVRTALEVILAQSRRMRKLISRLLFLARSDRGALEIRHDRFDIGLAAEEAAAVHYEEAEKKRIAICVEAEEGIYIDGDEILITQMISNLLSNAVKYGREDGWVHVRITRENEDVILCVQDNGQGIQEEKLHHIWERFYRADTARGDSYGLGLPIARRIVQAHSGEIGVTSEKGKGTTFTVRLPA